MSLSSVSKAMVSTVATLVVAVMVAIDGVVADHLPSVILAAVLIVAGGLSLRWMRRADESLRKACDVLAAAARGNLDRRVLNIRGHGVVGQMLTNVNRLLDLTEAFTKEADAAMACAAEGRYFRQILLSGLSGEFSAHAALINAALASMAERTKAFVGEASGIGDTIKTASQAMAATATELEATSRQMSEIAATNSKKSAEVARISEEASSDVETVASAAEQVSAGIREIADRVTRSAVQAKETVREVASTDQDIQSLLDAAQHIGDVVSLITAIANQTNLLALNATIEAARAGEAGKGFAVVAGEVKTLANQTARATGEIVGQIDTIRTATETAVSAIRKIAELVHDIDSSSTAIAATTEQQSMAMVDISRSIRNVSSGVRSVAHTISDVAGTAGTATEAAGQVLLAAGELAERTVKMNDGIDRFVDRVCVGIGQHENAAVSY